MTRSKVKKDKTPKEDEIFSRKDAEFRAMCAWIERELFNYNGTDQHLHTKACLRLQGLRKGQNIANNKHDNYGNYLVMSPSEKHGSVVIIVRRHQDKISSSSIKVLKELQTKEGADEAWLITNNDYTRVSISLAESLNVKLLDKSDLEHIVNRYNTNYYQGF